MGNDNKSDKGALTENERVTDNPSEKDINSYKNTFDSLIQRLRSNKKLYNGLKMVFKVLLLFTGVLFFFFFIIFLVPAFQELSASRKPELTNNQELKKDPAYKKTIILLRRDIERFSRKYNSFTPGQSYIVINTTDNRFFLYRNKKLIREGFCSSGSYTMLQTEGDKKWIFKTPKGKYWIRGKTTNPVWKKPDWAFVEEGLPIPPKDHFSRFEYGVLGDYAMSIGDGYLIHGTIYKRFLGMPVTHGCVRLNDEDLEAIFNTLSIGSKVYIF
jgi:hypothetical protein